jgi:hypothetical protein
MVPKVVILFAAAAFAVAGCGGGGGGGQVAPSPPLTKAAYQAKLQSISADIAKGVGKTSSVPGKVAKSDVDKLVKAFHTIADRLREVNPPPAVKALHARLIKTMDDLGDEFPAIAEKLNKAGKDPNAAIAALFGAHAIQELIKLGNEFKAKGYNLNLNP